MSRTHERKSIRQNLVTILKSGVPSVSNRVYPQRKIPVPTSKLPAILVYTTNENNNDIDNVNVKRMLSISVEIQDQGTDEITVSEQLDDLASAVEIAIQNNERLNDIAVTTTLRRTQEAFADEGKTIFGGVKMDYECVYYTENIADEGADVLQTMAGSISGLESENTLPQ